MHEPPWFPEYRVETSDMGPGALINNATDVRLTFRVPNEKLEEVLRTLLPNESIQPYMKGLTIGG